MHHVLPPNQHFPLFRSNLLKALRVDLKTCLGLVLPTNTASSSSGKIEAGFWVMLSRGPNLLLCGPYYTVLSYCMITTCLVFTITYGHRKTITLQWSLQNQM